MREATTAQGIRQGLVGGFTFDKNVDGYLCTVQINLGYSLNPHRRIDVQGKVAHSILDQLFRDQYRIHFHGKSEQMGPDRLPLLMRQTNGSNASPEILDIFDKQMKDRTFERKMFSFYLDKSVAEQKDKAPERTVNVVVSQPPFPKNFNDIVNVSYDRDYEHGEDFGGYHFSHPTFPTTTLQMTDPKLLKAANDGQASGDQREKAKHLKNLLALFNDNASGTFSMTTDANGDITTFARANSLETSEVKTQGQTALLQGDAGGGSSRQPLAPSSAPLPEILRTASRESMSRSRSGSKPSTKERG